MVSAGWNCVPWVWSCAAAYAYHTRWSRCCWYQWDRVGCCRVTLSIHGKLVLSQVWWVYLVWSIAWILPDSGKLINCCIAVTGRLFWASQSIMKPVKFFQRKFMLSSWLQRISVLAPSVSVRYVGLVSHAFICSDHHLVLSGNDYITCCTPN
jgi:hypothetical protein